MAKNIKDYIHLYLGCRVFLKFDLEKFKGSKYDEGDWPLDTDLLHAFYTDESMILIPQLRPLSDMQEWEMHKYDIFKKTIWDFSVTPLEAKGYEYGEEIDEVDGWHFISFTEMAEITNTIRSLGFDIDGLIEAGLAVDAINNSFSKNQ